MRRQVCRRVRRRIEELGLSDLRAYRRYLDSHPEEWRVLDALTPITISRFYRDRAVFESLEHEVLPVLAAGRRRVRAWCAGCASGEEPYSLALLWHHALAPRIPGVTLEVLATDIDPVMLERARRGEYQRSSLDDLPAPWRQESFERPGDAYLLRSSYRDAVALRRHDLRGAPPAADFDLVLCRNVAFTYFDAGGQEEVLRGLSRAIRPGGALVLGLHEDLPDPASGFEPWPDVRSVHRRRASVGPAGR